MKNYTIGIFFFLCSSFYSYAQIVYIDVNFILNNSEVGKSLNIYIKDPMDPKALLTFNNLALEAFNQVIKRFPESKYAKDSRQKIILVNSNIAAKHMEIGRFYLNNKKYIAALNRFKIVIDEFSITKFTPEALHRMVEAYYEMGMYEESYNTAALLGYNYPNSKWYKLSYNLVEQIDGEETFLKKIRNFFDG